MRDLSGTPSILHVDMDAFFASVEVLDDPTLAGLPVIVGGAGARGVVASCTYEARVFGVRSAMPSVRARQLCPQAVFLPGRHGRYAEISGQLHRILTDITPLVEPIGLDEAFLNVAGAIRMLGSPETIAQRLRGRVRSDLSLDCAVGIGRSKMIAKLASRAAKPRVSRAGLLPGPGVVAIAPTTELAFLHGHQVEALWGVGPATATRLHELGVRTVGDLAAIPPETLVRRIGKASGLHLAALARGDDPSPVTPDRAAKSIGHEETFSQDLVDPRSSNDTCCEWPSRWRPCCGVPPVPPARSRSRSSSAISRCRRARTPWTAPSRRAVPWDRSPPPSCRESTRAKVSGYSA